MMKRKYNIYSGAYVRAWNGQFLGQDSGEVSVRLAAGEHPTDLVNPANSLAVTYAEIWVMNGGAWWGSHLTRGIRIASARWSRADSLLYFTWISNWPNTDQDVAEFFISMTVEVSFEQRSMEPASCPHRKDK